MAHSVEAAGARRARPRVGRVMPVRRGTWVPRRTGIHLSSGRARRIMGRMSRFHRWASFVSFAVHAPRLASADVPPPDSCDEEGTRVAARRRG